MSNAIAVWAYPDSNTVTGTITVGVVAYHSTGIDRVVFSVDDGATTTVTAMTQNPGSLDWDGNQEYEYVYTINTALLDDGSHTVQATAYPETGTATELEDRTIQVWNSGSPASWYVAKTGNDTTGDGSTGNPYLTINKACLEATGGDTIYVRDGTYDYPTGSTYGFTRFVTITHDVGHSVTISNINSAREMYGQFMKFVGITFTTPLANAPFYAATNQTAHHLWFHQCPMVGYGRNEVTNEWPIMRFRDSNHVTITECPCTDAGTHIVFGTADLDADKGNLIIRGCDSQYQTCDGWEWNGFSCLVTGNRNRDITKSGGAAFHCDHLQSNHGVIMGVARNNLMYNGRDQGNKFGGFASANNGLGGALNQQYYDVALINNVFHMAQNEGVNLRFETNYKDFSNVLVWHNTFYGGSSVFVVNASCPMVDGVVQNNIFWSANGGEELGPESGFTIDHNHHLSGSDPLFTNVSGGDFTFGAISPCRYAGTPVGVNRDIRNYDRNPTTPDLGAYEYLDYEASPDYTTMIVLGVRS